MYYPLNYEHINALAGRYNPSPVKPYNNEMFEFWSRSLFQRACSVLEFELPEEWQGSVKDFFQYCIFGYGFVVVFEDKKFGTIFQPCTLSGQNLWYQPTNAIVTNPAIPESLDLVIGEDCELIKLTPDYRGIFDVIAHYAEKLACLDNAINMSIINNKYGMIIGARNKTAAQALEKIFDKINQGQPAVFFDSGLIKDARDDHDPFIILDRELKKNYITTDQLMDMQTILNNFDTEVGIPTLPYQKKEKMVVSEAESRMIDATARSITWFETLTSSIGIVNDHFNTGISVKLRFDPDDQDELREEDDDEYSEDDSNRNA